MDQTGDPNRPRPPLGEPAQPRRAVGEVAPAAVSVEPETILVYVGLDLIGDGLMKLCAKKILASPRR